MQCIYTAKLFSGNFECGEEAIDESGLCKFHHSTYWKKHKEEHDKGVRFLIDIALQENSDLYLVGYHIPSYEFPKIIESKFHCEFAHFDECVDFSHVRFTSYISFYGTTFEKVVYCYRSKFNERPIFYHSTFKEDAIFTETRFMNGVNFYESVFLKWGNFSNSEFLKSSFFTGMRCLDRAFFTGATFVDKTQMSRCEFINVNFSYVDFQGEVNFSNIKLPKINLGDVKKKEFQIPIKFDYATMHERIRIIGKSNAPISLEGVSLLGVDLQKVEFSNVKWLTPKNEWRKMIINEVTLEHNKNFEDVSNIYAQLRKKYESELRFIESSNFFIGELESIKKGLQSGDLREKISSIPYSLYKYLSFYGESYFLPLAIWTPALIVVFFVLRNQTGYCSLEEECHMIGRITDSLSAFFLFPRSDGLIDIAERLLSIPILGSSFIALKRKFERRK